MAGPWGVLGQRGWRWEWWWGGEGGEGEGVSCQQPLGVRWGRDGWGGVRGVKWGRDWEGGKVSCQQPLGVRWGRDGGGRGEGGKVGEGLSWGGGGEWVSCQQPLWVNRLTFQMGWTGRSSSSPAPFSGQTQRSATPTTTIRWTLGFAVCDTFWSWLHNTATGNLSQRSGSKLYTAV